MTALRLLILSLVTFRLTILITKDNGPGWVMKKLRLWVKRETPPSAHLGEGIECPWCASLWLGALVATCEFMLQGNSVYEIILLLVALSGAAVILNQQFTKD